MNGHLVSTPTCAPLLMECSSKMMTPMTCFFSVATLIEFCSSLYPLNPGDVIITGTPEGVGFARGEFIQGGQTVRIEIGGLGHIENTTHYGETAKGGCGPNCSCHH